MMMFADDTVICNDMREEDNLEAGLQLDKVFVWVRGTSALW